MFRCPHCHAPTFSIWRKMSAGSWAPASCPACARPAYVNQPLLTSIYWMAAVLVLGYTLPFAWLAWWIFPLVLWLLMLIRCALRLCGKLGITVVHPGETVIRRLWLALLVLLPILSGIGFLLR